MSAKIGFAGRVYLCVAIPGTANLGGGKGGCYLSGISTYISRNP